MGKFPLRDGEAHAKVVFVVVTIGIMIGSGDAAIENSLQYKEHWYKTEELCPDLQEAVAGKDIDTANFPYKSVFRFMDHLQLVSEPYADLPCILEANGPRGLLSTALIEAIHIDNRPWNYSGAETCEEHIKLRLPEPTFLKRSTVPKIICRVPKSRSSAMKEGTGSMYHPYVWQFQKGKLGLSFSSFNLSHIINQQQLQSPLNLSDDTASDFWLDPDPQGRQFVQIVFTTRFGGMCSVRVQQYLVDPGKTLCGDIQTKSPFRLCGLYDCSEKETILRTLGFWTHRKIHDQLDILLQSNLNIPRWRREEPGYLEILVSTLRALIMPLLFLSVFYVTRRLRLKLANRPGRPGERVSRNFLGQRPRCQRPFLQPRGTLQNNNNNPSSGSSDSSSSSDQMLRPSLILNHVVYDIPGEYPIYEDLPPPYESIVQPPSYQVATTQVKQASPIQPPNESPPPPSEEQPSPPVPEEDSRQGNDNEETTESSEAPPRPETPTQNPIV